MSASRDGLGRRFQTQSPEAVAMELRKPGLRQIACHNVAEIGTVANMFANRSDQTAGSQGLPGSLS